MHSDWNERGHVYNMQNRLTTISIKKILIFFKQTSTMKGKKD